MGHTPYGYKIENGKAVINEEASIQVKMLFKSYLSGASLSAAAKDADIKAFHAGIGNMLKNKRYVGDTFYPAIIDLETFSAVQEERFKRAEKLGRIREKTKQSEMPIPTVFHFRKGSQQFDDPFKQAEYAYSLIATEVNENGSQ
jgi:hypothetical protein